MIRRLLMLAVAACLAAGPLAACDSDSGTPEADAAGDVATADASVEDTATPPEDTATPPDDTAADEASPDAGPDAASDADTPACAPPSGVRPPRLSEHAGVYDPIAHRVVFFGGSTAASIGCDFAVPTFEGDTWSYDIACDAWTKLAGPAPPARVRHVAAYDSTRHRMVLFGGRWRVGGMGNYTLYSDVWALDLATDAWTALNTTAGPSARVNPGFVYDPTGDRFLLFGGNTNPNGAQYTSLDDTWQLDAATGAWIALQPTFKPAPRLFPGALWDDARQSFVLFGGADDDAFDFSNVKYLDEVVVLDFREASPTWKLVGTPQGPRPQGRFWAGLVHDTDRDRYVAFGGHDDGALGNRNDLWALNPQTFAWTQLGAGDTPDNLSDATFCDFPPDFVAPDFDYPERRSGHLFVAGGGSAWTYGGKSDCGATDDLFRLDLATDTWEEVTAATVGESCLRKGGVGCNDLCF